MSSLEPGGKTDPSIRSNDVGGPNALQIGSARGHEGNPPAGLLTHEDLEKELNELKRAQSLLATEKHALEMITDGASVQEILQNLCICFDAESSDFISSVLLMDPDGERLPNNCPCDKAPAPMQVPSENDSWSRHHLEISGRPQREL